MNSSKPVNTGFWRPKSIRCIGNSALCYGQFSATSAFSNGQFSSTSPFSIVSSSVANATGIRPCVMKEGKVVHSAKSRFHCIFEERRQMAVRTRIQTGSNARIQTGSNVRQIEKKTHEQHAKKILGSNESSSGERLSIYQIDPDLDASLSLAQRLQLQFDEEGKRQPTEPTEPGAPNSTDDLLEKSLILAAQLAEEEKQEAKRLDEDQKLALTLYEEEVAASKAKQEAQKLQQQKAEQEAQKLQQQKTEEELAAQIKLAEEERYLEQQNAERNKAVQLLVRQKAFELDDTEEKLRVAHDKERFQERQVALQCEEQERRTTHSNLERQQQQLDKAATQELAIGAQLHAQRVENERELMLKQQERARVAAELERDRQRAAEEARRQEAARLAAQRAAEEARRREAARLAELSYWRDPNIYLYPSSGPRFIPATVKVETSPEWVLSTADPEVFAGGVGTRQAVWKVQANGSGHLRDGAGKACPSIKYDLRDLNSTALLRHFQLNSSNTFCVAAEDGQSFLERAGRRLGLEGQEIADMVEYCLPILMKSAWTNITFVPRHIFDSLVKLSIRPSPRQVIRVLAVLRNVPRWESTASATLDSLPTPDLRDGASFVAVEWGAVDGSSWDPEGAATRDRLERAQQLHELQRKEQYIADDQIALRGLKAKNVQTQGTLQSQRIMLRAQEDLLSQERAAADRERSSYRSRGLL
eukprot:g32055.t1